MRNVFGPFFNAKFGPVGVIPDPLPSPCQEQSDIARHPARKIKKPNAKRKTSRFQVALPPQIELTRFPAQSFRPAYLRYVDGPAAIATELAGKAQQHEFLFSPLRRLARLMEKGAPVVIGNMEADQFRHSVLALFRCNAPVFLLMLQFAVFMIRH